MTTRPKLTLKEKADILREYGIDVVLEIEGDLKYSQCPAVMFSGGDDEGQRAVDVLADHGIASFMLHRAWALLRKQDPCGGGLEAGVWLLTSQAPNYHEVLAPHAYSQ